MKKLILLFGLLAMLSSCTTDPACPKIEKKDQHLYRYFFTLDTGKQIEVHEIEYLNHDIGSEYCK